MQSFGPMNSMGLRQVTLCTFVMHLVLVSQLLSG